MSIQPPVLPIGSSPSALLESFRAAAQTHEAVRITLNGNSWDVQGVGNMPNSGREVAWVQASEGSTADTASVFVQALQGSFSAGISQAVARELDLAPRPHQQSLSSRTVLQALDMAETGRQMLTGVDFLTQLHFSATNRGQGFVQTCTILGVDASGLSQSARAQIDTQMGQHFAQAQAAGQTPVSENQATQWLRGLLPSAC